MSSDGGIWGDVKNADLSSLTFYSSDNAVAKVDSTGFITGQGTGSCSIYALLELSLIHILKAAAAFIHRFFTPLIWFIFIIISPIFWRKSSLSTG